MPSPLPQKAAAAPSQASPLRSLREGHEAPGEPPFSFRQERSASSRFLSVNDSKHAYYLI